MNVPIKSKISVLLDLGSLDDQEAFAAAAGRVLEPAIQGVLDRAFSQRTQLLRCSVRRAHEALSDKPRVYLEFDCAEAPADFAKALERLLDEWVLVRGVDPLDVMATLAIYAEMGRVAAEERGLKPGTSKQETDG
jgi:hypothetical protein